MTTQRTPEHRTFDLPGGTFHALTLGEGRPLVFLHGFPDHPPTAVPFLRALAGRGFRVVAPWLRGYAPSPLDGITEAQVVADMRALIDRWSPGTPVTLVGHDWGAVLTYTLCRELPDRISRAVTLAVPHVRTFARQLGTPDQLRKSWYMGLFQLPGAERIVAARDFALIDRLWRTWSPNLALADDQRRELHACLSASLRGPRRSGPLEWYRNARREIRAGLRAAGAPIATPLLYLHGADDGCISPPTVDDSNRFAGDYRREILPGLGHFLHLEDPDGIAERVSSW